MKRFGTLAILFVAVMLTALMAPAMASSLYIADNTLSVPYRWTSPSTYPGYTTPMDVIATDPSAWNISGVTVTWDTSTVGLAIATAYPQAGITVSGVNAGQTDIALGHNSVYDIGIKMSGPDQGKIYSGVTWSYPTQNSTWPNGNWIYGGKYLDGSGNSQDPLVIFSGGTYVGDAQINWATGLLTITFSNLLGGENWNKFGFQFGSGDCANEWMAGEANNPVPVPPSVLLLGSGLLGLKLLRRRVKT